MKKTGVPQREQYQNRSNNQDNKHIKQTTTPKLKQQPQPQECHMNNNTIVEAMIKTP